MKLSIIDHAYSECSSCGLFDNREQGFSYSKIPAQKFCGIMLVFGYPLNNKSHFEILDLLLREADINIDECILANAIGCSIPIDKKKIVPPTERYPSAIPSCLPKLLTEISTYQPKVVVAMGQEALLALTGDDVDGKERFATKWKIGWVSGGVFDARRLGIEGTRYLIPTYHPSFILHKAGSVYSKQIGGQFMGSTVIEHFIKAKKLVNEEAKFKVFRTVAYEPYVFNAYVKKVEKDVFYAVDIEPNAREPKDVTVIKCIGIQRFTKNESLEETLVVDTSKISGDLQKAVCKFLGDPKINKVFQNGIYDIEVLERLYGCKVNGYVGDTLLAHNSLYPDEPHHLHHIGFTYTDVEPWKTMDEVPKEQKDLWMYNAKDTRVTAESMRVLMKEMSYHDTTKVHDTDVKLFQIASRMNQNGLRIDINKRKNVEIQLMHRKSQLIHMMSLLLGKSHFNPSSSKEVESALIDDLGIIKRPKNGKTDIFSIIQYRDNDFVKHLIEYRKTNYLLWTYIKKMETDCNGIIDFKWNHISIRNGLWTSYPKFDEFYQEFGDIIIPIEDGNSLLNTEFSIYDSIYECTKDYKLKKILDELVDPDLCIAENVFGNKSKEMISLVKKITKLMFKGYDDAIIRDEIVKSPIYNGFLIPVNIVRSVINSFYLLFPTVLDYQQKIYQKSLLTGIVQCETSGRRRVFPFKNVDAGIAYWFPFQSMLAHQINKNVIEEKEYKILAITDCMILKEKHI